jgi:hypothetical protein
MSDPVTGSSSPPVVANNAASAPSPLDESAAQFIATLDAAEAMIPGYQPAHPETARLVRRYRGIKREAIPAAIAAVEQDPKLKGADSFDIERARFAVQFKISWGPAITRALTLVRNLVFSDDYNSALALKDSLQIYAIALAFGRDPSSPNAAAHATNIKRVLHRARANKKAAKNPPSAPEPAPATTPKAAS